MTLGAAGGRAYSAFHDVDTANFVDAATGSTQGRAKKREIMQWMRWWDVEATSNTSKTTSCGTAPVASVSRSAAL